MNLRLTPFQRSILERLAKGYSIITEIYSTQRNYNGLSGRYEHSVARLHNRGLVKWDGPIDEIEITELGRKALETKVK